MGTFPETVVSGPAVKANPTHDAMLLQPRHEAIDRSRVANDVEFRTRADLLQRERLVGSEEYLEAGPERIGAPEAGFSAAVQQSFEIDGGFLHHLRAL